MEKAATFTTETVETIGQRRARIAEFGSNLLTLAAISCAALGLWRMGADLDWAGDFAIRNGLLSHWQVWIGAAAACVYGSFRVKWLAPGEPAPDRAATTVLFRARLSPGISRQAAGSLQAIPSDSAHLRFRPDLTVSPGLPHQPSRPAMPA